MFADLEQHEYKVISEPMDYFPPIDRGPIDPIIQDISYWQLTSNVPNRVPAERLVRSYYFCIRLFQPYTFTPDSQHFSGDFMMKVKLDKMSIYFLHCKYAHNVMYIRSLFTGIVMVQALSEGCWDRLRAEHYEINKDKCTFVGKYNPKKRSATSGLDKVENPNICVYVNDEYIDNPDYDTEVEN